MFRLSLIALILIFSLGNAVKIEENAWNVCFDQTPSSGNSSLAPACQICRTPSTSIYTEASGSSYCPSAQCMKDACASAWQGCQCPPTLSTKDKQAYRQLSQGGLVFDDVQCGNNVTNGKECGGTPVCKDNTVYYVEDAVKPPKPICSCSVAPSTNGLPDYSCKWSAGGCFKKCTAIVDWPSLRSALIGAFPLLAPIKLRDQSSPLEKPYSLEERLAPVSATYSSKSLNCLKDMVPGSFCLIDADIPCANETIMGRKSQINVTCDVKTGAPGTGETKYTFTAIDTEAITCGISQCKNTTEKTLNCVELKNIYRDQMVCNQQRNEFGGPFTSKSAEYCLGGQWKQVTAATPQFCSADVPVNCKVHNLGVPEGMTCPFIDPLRVPVNPLCEKTGFTCTGGQPAKKVKFFKGCPTMPEIVEGSGISPFHSCWLGNQTGFLNIALCKKEEAGCLAEFPHGQQCIPQCPAGQIRKGAEGPYCRDGVWRWFDRRGVPILKPSCQPAPAKPKVDEPIPNQIPEQCKGDNKTMCQPCTFRGNRFLKDNLGKVKGEVAPYFSLAENVTYIDWPFCGEMKHLETAQVLCSEPQARLSGSEYVQCYNGELYLGGWFYSKWDVISNQGVLKATASCIKPGNTTVATPDPVLFCEEMDASLFGTGFSTCGKRSVDSTCTATCKSGFIPFQRVGLGFKTYFTAVDSQLICKRLGNGESARWEWVSGRPLFSCLDTCRAQDVASSVFQRRSEDLAPGTCQAPFLCDGVCSLYNADGVDCSGPACKFDALNCPKRTSIENNKFFNYSLKLEKFKIVVEFESKPANNTWLGIYVGSSVSNRQFSWAKHIGGNIIQTIDIETADIVSTRLVNGKIEPEYADLLTKDYEFRVFADLVVDSEPIYTSGLCFGTACQGKLSSHKIVTTKDIMKKKNLHAVTQEIVDLLKPELHLNDRVEFNRRIDIIKKVEEHSEKGESPADLWDDMYSHIEFHGDAKKYYEMTQIKKRSEQVQETTWKFNAAPGRCLSENPACQCSDWGNNRCNPSCNKLDCQYDGLDCGCLVAEMFDVSAIEGVINSSYTHCNQRARDGEKGRYYPVNTECEVRCGDGRVAPGGILGKLKCSADTTTVHGGTWSHNCLPPCAVDRTTVFDNLISQFNDNTTLRNITETEKNGQNFKDCNKTLSSTSPYEPNRGICIFDCNNGLTPANVRIECSPVFGGGLPGKVARQWMILDPLSIRALMESRAFCPVKVITPPPPSPVPAPVVICPSDVPASALYKNDVACNNKTVGTTCAVSCKDNTLKKFGPNEVTCTQNGQWSEDVFCLPKCKVTDTGRNGPVEMTSQCVEAYSKPGSPNTCDIGCGNNTIVGNLDGGMFYDGVTSCPKIMTCNGASFSVNPIANLTLACLTAATCADLDKKVLADRSATCNATNNKFIKHGQAVIPDCGTLTLDMNGKEGPVCYDNILGSTKATVCRWLRSDGTGIKNAQRFNCVAPPAPVSPVTVPPPAAAPSAAPVPVGALTCKKDTLEALYKNATRNWHLKYEYAVLGRYADGSFDGCTTYTAEYPDGKILPAFCDPAKSDIKVDVKVTCTGGQWVVPNCPSFCPQEVSNNKIIFQRTALGSVAEYSCVNPEDTVVFQKKTGEVWSLGPYCVLGAKGPEFQENSKPTCINRCQGEKSGPWRTGGTCEISSDSGACDYFCDNTDEADCLVPACKGIANTTMKCAPTKVKSIVAFPTRLVLTYSTTTPLPKNAHVEINELTSNNTLNPDGRNYLFFLPEIKFEEEEIANEVMKSANFTILEDFSGLDTPAIRKATFTTSKLQFTFYQDLSRSATTKPLAQGNLCGGIGRTTAALCQTFSPKGAKPLNDNLPNVTIVPECAAGGCNCNQVGDGVCDLACLNPACKEAATLESQDCKCYNPELYVRGGSLTDCKPGDSKEIGGSCSYTCPDGSSLKTTCQVARNKTYPTFSWNTENCKRQCKSIPYFNHTAWGGQLYIKYDNPDCNGILAPVNHGKMCFPECSVGTPNSNFMWFVCNDGEWVQNGTGIGREREYCSVGGKPCPWNDLLNSDKRIDDVMQDDKSFVAGVTCSLKDSVTNSYTVVNSSKDTSISHNVICQPQCKQGYDPSGASQCVDGAWSPKSLGSFSCSAAKNCSYFDIDKFFSGGRYSCKLGDTPIELWRFNTTDFRPAARGTVCSFECASGYVLTPPSAQVQCSLVNGAPAWVTLAEKEPIFTKGLQNLYYPICHPGCTYGVPVNGQQRDTGNNLKCIGTPVFGACAGWSCATGDIPYTRDVCSSKEPVCHHAKFISDTTDSGVTQAHAFSSVCTDMASCWKYCIKHQNCSFADFESHLRVWAVPFTSSSWHRKLPYCFAPCNTVNLTRSGLGFKCSTKSGNYVPHGKTCDVECNEKNAIWTVQIRGTVVGAYNDFPVCYDGVFRGNTGSCVAKDSAKSGSDFCLYSELNQVLREQKLLGFKCKEVNEENAKFTTTCEPGYSMNADGIADSTLTVVCKAVPNSKLFRWTYSIGTKELQHYEVPMCQKDMGCPPLKLVDMEGAVADANGIVCQHGKKGDWCSVKCQDGFIPYHTPNKTNFQTRPGMYCEGGTWQGEVVCREGCADVMECLPNVAAKSKYTYKCDGVCQGNFIGDLDGINCAGPVCNYDAAPDAPASKTCADNLFGATIEDTRAYSFRISIPEGKRLTDKAWVGFYAAGEPDNQRYLDRYELRITHGGQGAVYSFETKRSHATYVGGDKATEYEVRVFPDVAWDAKPLSAVKITKNGIANVSGGAAAAPASGSGPWVVIAVIFIVLFIITLVAAIALFLKLRGAQSSSDNQYSKYTERL